MRRTRTPRIVREELQQRPKGIVPTRRPGRPTILREIAARPARFVVGMDEDGTPPADELRGAPATSRFYLGRVEHLYRDPDHGDQVALTVWEQPNGRELLVDLPVGLFPDDTKPRAGDLVRIWSWVEYDHPGQPADRIHVKLEQAELSEETKTKLAALGRRMQEELEARGAWDGEDEA